MTNSLASNDVSIVYAGYKKYRDTLVEGNVELYEIKPDKVDVANDEAKDNQRTGSSRASLHGKYLGYDLSHIFVGSFNLDARSFALNTEIGVLIESPLYAKLLSDNFDQQAIIKGYRLVIDDNGDLEWVTRENGKEIRFDKAPETSFWKRFGTNFMSIFVPEKEL